MTDKIIAVFLLFGFMAGLAVLFIGAYGGFLDPRNPFEFYCLTIMVTVISGLISVFAIIEVSAK